MSGTWIFQKSSPYKYQNKNKQTRNHYLSNTITGPDSSNCNYCKQYFPSEYQPDTVYVQWDFIEGKSVRSLLQEQYQHLAVNGNFVHCRTMSSVAEGGEVSIGKQGLDGNLRILKKVFFRRLGKYCCLCSVCLAHTPYTHPRNPGNPCHRFFIRIPHSMSEGNRSSVREKGKYRR